MLHKLYRNHAKVNSKESQQAMAILKAGKLEDNSDSSQKLIASLNRGGVLHYLHRRFLSNLKACLGS